MNAKNTDKKLLWLGMALFLASAACLSLGTRAQESWSKLPAGFSQDIPPHLGPASFLGALGGTRGPAADWVYIDTLQYLGNSLNKQDGDYKEAYRLYREVLWLDPYFHFAVLEGCSFLTWFVHRLDEGRLLLEEAMRVDPKFSRYRMYYAAMAYIEKDVDHRAMLALLRSEAEKEDAPEMLLRSVGNLITRYGSRDEALRFWLRLWRRSRDPLTLGRAKTELAKLGVGVP